MSKLKELDNSLDVRINSLYYTGKNKRNFLKNKQKTLKQIPQGLVLGLGYTISDLELHDGVTLETAEHSTHIDEYIFVKSLIEGDDSIFFEHLSEIVFCDKYGIESVNTHIKEYIKDLKKNGYVRLPNGFMSPDLADEIVETYELIKCAKKGK